MWKSLQHPVEERSYRKKMMSVLIFLTTYYMFQLNLEMLWICFNVNLTNKNKNNDPNPSKVFFFPVNQINLYVYMLLLKICCRKGSAPYWRGKYKKRKIFREIVLWYAVWLFWFAFCLLIVCTQGRLSTESLCIDSFLAMYMVGWFGHWNVEN